MLTKAEERIIKHLWATGPCFMKDLYDQLPEPKPAKTTVATLLKRMIDKDAIGFRTYGNSREYFAKLNKRSYFGGQLSGMIADFFADSPKELASLFAEETDLTKAQLEELQAIVDRKLDQS